MKYYPSVILSKKYEVEGTFIFRCALKRDNNALSYLPGQYVYLANPTYKNPWEAHPFSIASSPTQKKYLEFCIKVYGPWTQELSKKKIGDSLYISQNTGNFIWNSDISHAAFLLGGIGISPIMSMLRFIAESNKQPSSITMLYGNRTPDTIAYKRELELLQDIIQNFNILHIFSDLSGNHSGQGYHGFITEDIIKKEINLRKKPTFFMVGPPIFLQKMKSILQDLTIRKDKIKSESLASTHFIYTRHQDERQYLLPSSSG